MHISKDFFLLFFHDFFFSRFCLKEILMHLARIFSFVFHDFFFTVDFSKRKYECIFSNVFVFTIFSLWFFFRTVEFLFKGNLNAY